MRILLLAMPNSADIIDYFVKLPNLGLASIAGSLPGHDVKIIDLVLCKKNIKRSIEDVWDEFKPQLVGLSAMTFQFDTLLRIARFIRQLSPSAKVAAGGCHVTLMAEELTKGSALPLDFLIRGEGEFTFRELVDELENESPCLNRVAGLSYRQDGAWTHNPDRPLSDLDKLPLPNREARAADGFFLFNKSMDVAETSRGCLYSCKFCSISCLYGRTFRPFPLNRIISDLHSIRYQGKRAVFFADDNITCDRGHFRSVCRAITESGLNDMEFGIQASASGLACDPELVSDMAEANFRHVFVGFESMDGNHLAGMRKPTTPDINRRAAELIRQHGMGMIAGVVFGFPSDTKQSVRRNYRLLKRLKPDLIYSQYLTPYPGTVLRDELLAAGLITNPCDFSTYDGFGCNIRTHHLDNPALYQALKRESLKSYFDLSLHVDNHYLKEHPRSFFKAIGKAMLTVFRSVIRGRQFADRLDI